MVTLGQLTAIAAAVTSRGWKVNHKALGQQVEQATDQVRQLLGRVTELEAACQQYVEWRPVASHVLDAICSYLEWLMCLARGEAVQIEPALTNELLSEAWTICDNKLYLNRDAPSNSGVNANVSTDRIGSVLNWLVSLGKGVSPDVSA